jgi:uncharacterized protein
MKFQQRDVALDALRGFAILGIIVVNAPFFAGPASQMPQTALDAVAFWFSTAFGMGKFFLIFSFLFGFGFSLMLLRSASNGTAPGPRFFRRLLGLFIIGAAHAMFLFFGDILMLYAILGIVLWCCQGKNCRSLIVTSAAVGLVGLVLQAAAMVFLPEAAYDFAAETQRTANYLGSFWQVTRQRVADLPETLAFIAIFNGLPALSMFLLGFATGRDKLFPPAPGSPVFGIARVCFALGAAISAIASYCALVWSDPLTGALLPVGAAAISVVVAVGPILSFGMALTMFERFNHWREQRITQWLAKTGSNSLTAYVFHSLLLAALFCGWGFGSYNSLGAAWVLIIGVTTWFVVIATVNIWRIWFRYGPDEWLLRSITDLQWKPLLNPPSATTSP